VAAKVGTWLEISLESAISALVTREIAIMKAAVYVRVSTDQQTVRNQLADLERLAQARGYEITVYEVVESAGTAGCVPAPVRRTQGGWWFGDGPRRGPTGRTKVLWVGAPCRRPA
jgi:hypothetical protein